MTEPRCPRCRDGLIGNHWREGDLRQCCSCGYLVTEDFGEPTREQLLALPARSTELSVKLWWYRMPCLMIPLDVVTITWVRRQKSCEWDVKLAEQSKRRLQREFFSHARPPELP